VRNRNRGPQNPDAKPVNHENDHLQALAERIRSTNNKEAREKRAAAFAQLLRQKKPA
jgi:hypothetical protein